MDLTPGEEAIIALLRGEVGSDFCMNIAWLGPVWTVSITSEVDGILAGKGDTFRQALHAAFGVEAGSPDPATDEGVGGVRAVLQLVSDTSAPLGSMRREGMFRVVDRA